MKLAFISDIHGNSVALQSVLEDINKRNVNQIFVLGDICFRGIEPKRSLEIIRQLDCKIIKGNADEWVVRGVQKEEIADNDYEMMKKERNWTYAKLDHESIIFLEKLPKELELLVYDVRIHAFHATPNSLFKVVQPYEKDDFIVKKLMEKNADIFIYSHIHKPFIRYINGKCLINTGSVGLPFDGVTKPSYCIVEIDESGYQTSIVRVEYDLSKVIGMFQRSDYPNKDLLIEILRRGKNSL